MSSDDLFEEPDEPQRPRDRKVDEAKEVIFVRYFSEGTNVYYGRQLEIWMERDFFHWITKKALNELVEEGRIGFTLEELGTHRAHFYHPRRHRYPRRQIKEIIGLIAEYSDPIFTRALGHHGELLISDAFAHTGFRIRARKVKQVGDRRWTKTGHDLDYLIERDGVQYGVEVKNQLGYIDQTEFQVKMEMCDFFGVRPLFATRMMPGNYIYGVNSAGGYSMITQNQNYPLLADGLARRISGRLRLPVAVIQRLPDTALARFEQWHQKALKRVNRKE